MSAFTVLSHLLHAIGAWQLEHRPYVRTSIRRVGSSVTAYLAARRNGRPLSILYISGTQLNSS